MEGNQRARIERFLTTDESFSAVIEPLAETLEADEREQEVLIRSAVTLFDQYVKLNKKVPPEVLTSLSSIDEAGPPGGHHGRAHVAQARREAARAGDDRHPGAHRASRWV